MIIQSLSSTHFLADGEAYPRAYLVHAHPADDAFLASLSTSGKSFAVPLGSVVNGVTPTTQGALIALLAPVVTGNGSGSSGTDSTGSALPDFSGFQSSGTKNADGNPLTIVFEDATYRWTQTFTWTGTTAWSATKFVRTTK